MTIETIRTPSGFKNLDLNTPQTYILSFQLFDRADSANLVSYAIPIESGTITGMQIITSNLSSIFPGASFNLEVYDPTFSVIKQSVSDVLTAATVRDGETQFVSLNVPVDAGDIGLFAGFITGGLGIDVQANFIFSPG
jgi:hypothetical protein